MSLRFCKSICGPVRPLLQSGRVYSSFSRPSPSTDPSANSVVFSGIQPTGVPHLGNYLGALQPWRQLQDTVPSSAKLIFCLVDLHALTTQPDPDRLRQWKREALAALLAVGLNPERCTIFFQSEVTVLLSHLVSPS